MKKLLWVMLVCLLLSGCDLIGGQEATLSTKGEDWEDFSYSIVPWEPLAEEFYTETISTAEGVWHYISYEGLDGQTYRVADLGTCDSPWFIIGDRIYYTTGLGLYSMDFSGENIKRFVPSGGESYTIDYLFRETDGWIYCRCRKTVESVEDPAAAPGAHTVTIHLKVTTDFTQYEEIDIS